MPFRSPGGSVAINVTTGAFTVCTSGTRPGTPSDGAVIYESDTGQFLIWNAALALWTPPWGTAWGQLDAAGATANTSVTTGTGYHDIDGLSVTVDVIAGRRYHAHVSGHVLGAGAGASLASVAIVDALGLQLGRPGRSDVIVATTQAPIDVWSEFTPALTSTFTVTAQLAGLIGPNVSVYNVPGTATLTVTDAGPN